MSDLLHVLLINFGLFKVTTKRIKKWIKNKKVVLLNYAFNSQDFRVRKNILSLLNSSQNIDSSFFIKKGLKDPVYPVVEETVILIKRIGQYSDFKNEIEKTLKFWAEKEAKFKESWQKESHFSKKILIDKSQMIRLKKLKRDLAKPKGSMSIG